MNFSLPVNKIKGKKVLLRVDLNSPISKGKIIDNPRFKEASNMISLLLKNKCSVVIISHQGRKGDSDYKELKQHSRILSKYTHSKIKYIDDLFGKKAIKSIRTLKNSNALILKNVRSEEDESNLSKNRYSILCKNFDFFINDAFSVSHREQSSIIIPPKYLPSYFGINMQREITALQEFKKLFSGKTLFIIGGSKIADYLPLFNALKNKKIKLLASGVLANLILLSKGHDLGFEEKWLKEKGYTKFIPELKKLLKEHSSQIILPIDFAIDTGKRREISLSQLPTNKKLLDVGNKTISFFKDEIKGAKAIFMKGPLGFSEYPKFSFGTTSILKELSNQSKSKKVFTLLGGGHLSTTISKYHIKDNFSYLSTSGGALIAFLSGKTLPGIEAIRHQTIS